jgi:hypothetical protein
MALARPQLVTCSWSAYRLYADDIDRKLAAIPPEHGAICLLCWERRITGPECHRRLIAAWLEERYGAEVPELDPARGGTR